MLVAKNSAKGFFLMPHQYLLLKVSLKSQHLQIFTIFSYYYQGGFSNSVSN